jgi:hypothetical protein
MPANIYGQKQAGCVWNNYLVTKLWEINFKPSLIDIDDCIFYQDDVIILSTMTMESFWDNQTSSYVASSTSYRTPSCPLKIKAALRIMLESISRNAMMVSLNCCNKP